MPAIVVVAVLLAAILLNRNSTVPGMFMFVAGLGICLAGLWMVATHVPLVAQAARNDRDVTWAATLCHSALGAAVALLGVVWVTAW